MIDRRRFIASTVAASLIGFRGQSALAQNHVVASYETIEVGDIEIGYRTLGSGDPLVMIMGFAGTKDAWDTTFLDHLAQTRQVIVFDNRGIASSTANGRYPFSQLADDAIGLIDALGLDRVDLFGWSLGGMVSLDLATRHRERVRYLVAHAGDPGGAFAITGETGSFLDFGANEEDQLDMQLKLMFPSEWIEQHRDQAIAIFSRPQLAVDGQSVLLQANALLDWYNQEHVLRSIESPTLILHGSDDIVIPVGNAQLLADIIPGSWLVRLPGGHGLHYQLPVELATITDHFLNSAS